MKKSYLSLLSLSMLAILLTGCNSAKSRNTAHNDTRFLGLVEYNPASYKLNNYASFSVTTNELINRPNVSGDNLSLAWGLLNFEDY